MNLRSACVGRYTANFNKSCTDRQLYPPPEPNSERGGVKSLPVFGSEHPNSLLTGCIEDADMEFKHKLTPAGD